jgi:hypothetical protein
VEIGSDFIRILSKKEEYPERESFSFGTAAVQSEVTALQRNECLSGCHDNGTWIGSKPALTPRHEVHL